jgi:predicted DNA-binding transcriptional regulator AlpA
MADLEDQKQTVRETPQRRQGRHAVTALEYIGRKAVVAPEYLSPLGVCQFFSIGKSTLWRLISGDPTFPKSQRLGNRDVQLFSVEALREWMKAQPRYVAK